MVLVVLDRDGTINYDAGYLARENPGRVEIKDCFCAAVDWILSDIRTSKGR